MKPLAKQSVVQTSFRDRLFGRVIDVPGVVSDSEVSNDLFGDAFWSLYGRDLKDETPEGRETNRTLLDWADTTPGWVKAKDATRGNLPATIKASALMHAAISSDAAMKEALDMQQAAAELQEQQAGLQAAADALAENDPEISQELSGQATAMDGEVQAAAEAAADKMDAVAASPYNKALMRSITAEAGEEAAEVAAAMDGWGHDAGKPGTMDITDALSFLEASKGKAHDILKIAGRCVGFARSARVQTVGQGHVPAGVKMGRKIGDLLPSEAMLMTGNVPAEVQAVQWAKFLKDGLLSVEHEEMEDDSGDFVAAVDISGSMLSRAGGQLNVSREVAAKGIALGCAQLAQKDGREYSIFSFSTRHDPVFRANSQQGWPEHLQWASNTVGGGTDFDHALTVAIEELENLGGKDRADILFASDGDAGISDITASRWAEYSARTGARLIYVGVNSNPHMREIDEIADKAVWVDDMLKVEDQQEIASKVGVFLNRR